MTFTWGLDCLGITAETIYATSARPGAIWPYITGTGEVLWPPNVIGEFARRGAKVITVNQGYGQMISDALNGDEFDIESGAWTINQFRDIVRSRRVHHWTTRGYATWANYGAAKQALAEHGIGDNVWWRIADWNIDQHLAELELHADVYAGQWASPSSNPTTLLPGTTLTLDQAKVDLNVLLIEDTSTWRAPGTA